jgi:hypothetical protein
VPFELGRPFGPPSDTAFQKQVVLAALRLLEAKAGGPVLLADFPEDDPREAPDPRWRPPIEGKRAGEPLADGLIAEVTALVASYARSRAERGRTTVGLSGLTPAAAAEYAAAWLRSAPPESPVADLSPILCLRFAVDDLKAYALEAAITSSTKPSSRQLGDWLWNESSTGAAIPRLAPAAGGQRRRSGEADRDDVSSTRLAANAGRVNSPPSWDLGESGVPTRNG